MLMRCAMGHMPSTRKIGEMTTPMATSIASMTIFRMCSLFIFCTSLNISVSDPYLKEAHKCT